MQYIYIYIYIRFVCVCIYIGSAIFFPFSFIHTHTRERVYIYFFLGTEAFCEVRWSPIVLREHVLSRREKNIVTRKTLSGTLATICPYTHTHTHTHTHVLTYIQRTVKLPLTTPLPTTHPPNTTRIRAREGRTRCAQCSEREREVLRAP